MKHLELQIKDFSQQFAEQVKCIESKVIVDSSILSNVLDLYKRRAAIEQEYSENLLKLSSSITQRNNLENLKRPKWKNYSPVKVLNSLLASTDHTARTHKHLGDIYGRQMTQRIMDMQDDCSRLTKRSTEILQRRHSELVHSVNNLLLNQKDYIKLFNEADDCRRKTYKAMDQLDREVIRCQDKKKDLDKNPKIKKLKEEYTEKDKVFKEKQTESTTARNKYIIHLASLKDAIDHFYTNELTTIIQCSQYGFHNNLTRLAMNHSSCEEALVTVHNSISNLFSTTANDIDANNDTGVFFDAHKSIFTLKEQLHFSPAKDDNMNKIMKTEEKVENDLKNMHVKFDMELRNISKFFMERKFNIEVLSKSYNDLISQSDYDVVDYICYQSQPDQSAKERSTSLPRESINDGLYSSIQRKVKEPRLMKEAAYFKLMEEYLSDQINMVNLSTKLKNVETVLSSPTDECDLQCYKGIEGIQRQTAVMIGMKSKLFGGDLKKYSSETKEMVPFVVRSCIRLINLHGMRNVGVFRVPGSQIDVQSYKAQFELGCDPIKELPGSTNDVNLAASLLKLYFRELDPPIFDQAMFTSIVDKYSAVKQKEEAIVEFMKEIVMTLEPSVYATVNYLVSFVSHLSEFSNENCMDILNLAIIFGPCLMPIPEDKNNQLFHYQTIINHVAQCLITAHQEIFTRPTDGPIYQKYQSMSDVSPNTELVSAVDSERSAFFSDSLTSSMEDDGKNIKRNESVRYARSKPLDIQLRMRRNSDSERHRNLTAVAIANYVAKIDQEVSFDIGDTILLKKKISDQWWSGSVIKSNDRKSPAISGIIPSAYISISSPENRIVDIEPEAESDVKQPDSTSQQLSDKDDKKISLGSADSDNDLEFSSRNGSIRRPSMGNTTEFSDTGESKSLDSIENIIDIDVGEDAGKQDNSSTKESPEKVDVESVKVRTGSLMRMLDTEHNIDIVDEDLRQTMQGLQKIEQLNVRKHRDTIHIDKSLLASKFVSPLRPEPLMFFAKDNNNGQARPTVDERPTGSQTLEFKIKRPGNVSSLASSFEMSQGPRVIQHKIYDSNSSRKISTDDSTVPIIATQVPPPTFPKPKFNKK